jgi:hypothetical protein
MGSCWNLSRPSRLLPKKHFDSNLLCFIFTHYNFISLSLSLSLSNTHTLSLFFSLCHTHIRTHALTHTHTLISLHSLSLSPLSMSFTPTQFPSSSLSLSYSLFLLNPSLYLSPICSLFLPSYTSFSPSLWCLNTLTNLFLSHSLFISLSPSSFHKNSDS